MDTLPARLAIDRERLTPGVCMLDNQSGIFQLVSPMGQVYRPNRVLLDYGAQPLVWVFGGQSLSCANSRLRHHLVEPMIGLIS